MPKCLPPTSPLNHKRELPENLGTWHNMLQEFEIIVDGAGSCIVMQLKTNDGGFPTEQRIPTVMLSIPAAKQLSKALNRAVKEHLRLVPPTE